MPPTPAPPGDEEILEAVQALQRGASPDAFEIIFQRFYSPLYKFFANRPSLRDEADDLTQATLLRAYERIHQYTPEAENMWKNTVRERLAVKRVPPGEIAELTAGERSESQSPMSAVAQGVTPKDERPDPEEAVLAHERTRVLRDAIESLPPGMRRCIELRLLSDLKYQEIANVTGIGLNSVRSQLFEARQRLKNVLDHYFQGADF
jgi:RNA polymerase sigma-70 factor (ECF subfamily)